MAWVARGTPTTMHAHQPRVPMALSTELAGIWAGVRLKATLTPTVIMQAQLAVIVAVEASLGKSQKRALPRVRTQTGICSLATNG